jgi:sec-independent protein translocase protein TatC
MHEEDKAPFTDHLEELRSRLIKCIIAVVVGFILTYAFKENLFDILMGPLSLLLGEKGDMVFTSLPEAFFTYLKVSALAGLMLAAPVVFYQFWMFIAPGLYSNERKLLLPIVCLSSFFFVGGALFGYFVVFPTGFKFFLSFTTDDIRAMLSMSSYLSFAAKLLLAFGLAFELPLVLTFLARLGIVSVPFLKKNRKYALVLFFIGSAILTPPDVISQIMMAFPLMLLYELSIVGAKFFGKKKRTDEYEDEDEDEESTEE